MTSNILGLQGMKPKKCLLWGYDFSTHHEASFYRTGNNDCLLRYKTHYDAIRLAW